ncbi:hypothetical protein HETIRDRAFT_442094 [Heterobasidion irregulare TC 32-1]|uniref:NAD-dependent epimerase/dehydratase domain-containing protein n=1 Tax=Heterobasidion irregulare (strain TC 32-1) TaxID=747525 RepID=W4JUB5_HETIT|nr:uncharacterized protein HETIRDRAFT_442094 [Heterobasidion irregulare TC 32-1]ETW76675.1 hypothetical protein HETIRDRAFT_442094 [Heterobasidion irregulare TC 32-1]
MSRILVTGASGFLGSVVVDQLLAADYKVRGTVRSSKADRVKKAYASFGDKFEITVVDDLATSDLTAAFQGVTALIHVGSPLAGSAVAEEVLKSAISGTERVLDFAVKAGVKKVVVTSSVAAMTQPSDMFVDRTFDETEWNPMTYEEASKPEASGFEVYCASKKLAEEVVWKFAKEHPNIDFATVNPSFLYGPSGRGQVLDSPANGTNAMVYALIKGPKGRPIPNQVLFPNFIHVADAAKAHVLALAAPPSKTPKRLIVNGGSVTWKQAAQYLAESRPDLKDRLPVITGDEKVPEVWAKFDTSSAERLIGLKDYINWKETISSTIDDILEREKAFGVAVL